MWNGCIVMYSLKDFLYGVMLEVLFNVLVVCYGWVEMVCQVNINCFKSDFSIKFSFKFFCWMLWVCKEVEVMYFVFFDDDVLVEKVDFWVNWQKK